MKKLSIMLLALCLTSLIFAEATDLTDQAEPATTLRVRHANSVPYNGPRAPARLVDTLRLDVLNPVGYCWGIAYDWERDGLWVTQWNSAYNKMYCIQKHSPTTKIDSVILGSGVPTYRLGIGYVGSNTMRMAGYNNTVYTINMTTGQGSSYRTLPWSGCEGLDANAVDDVIYASDWTANACAWAKPAQSGTWNTWTVAPYPSGMTGAASATASPAKLFMVDEVTSGLAHIFQYTHTAGVPNTTPESVWTMDAGMTQASTADAAFDGQYVYVIDQNGANGRIWVYDVGIQLNDTVRWDFETGRQGWTHTNGVAFPGGWDVEPSNYKPTWTPPNAGDSTLWVDSDAYGTLVQDTALSPVLVPHAATTKWFKYGIGYNFYTSGEKLEIGIKYYNGSAWTVVPLVTYTADVNPRWDSFDVSAYATYPRIQLYYYYDGDYCWYAAIDNVSINGELYVASHDVATTAILNPGQYVTPGVATQPQASFSNLGNNPETFNTYFVIDSAGTVVYNQMINLTLNVGEDTTLTYPAWTPAASNGIVYHLIAYHNLGDPTPGNDTIRATTTTQSAFWKIYASSVPTAVYYNSCAYAEPNGTPTVYSLANYTSAAQTTIYEFNCNTQTWSTSSAVLSHAVARAAAATVRGKIYVMGGSTDLSTGLNYCQEFDPVAGTVTDRATMPTAAQFLTAAAWRDSLVYVLGGQSGSSYFNLVQIYDPATNAWTTGTAMPTTNRSFAMSISGDTIFFTGGYNGAYLTGSYIGVINPANPTQITWTAGPNIPTGPSGTPGRSRLQGAFVLGKFYFTGGDDHGTAAYDTWYWDPADNLWHQTLDKPTPISNSQCAVYVPFLDGGTFLCSGGYNTAGAAPTNACEGLINLGTGVEEKPGQPGEVTAFGFAPNMPNPVRNRVSLVFTTLAQGNVSLRVFDGTGRLVRDLSQGIQPAGTKTVIWDARDNAGRELQGGVYFVRLEANGCVASHKLVLVK